MKRPIIVVGEIAFVEMTKGYTATIDASSVEMVDGKDWTSIVGYRNTVYGRRNVKTENGRKTEYLHRVISGAGSGLWVDHKDGNTLNNRVSNLRVCTPSQNAMNRPGNRNSKSGRKGVFFDEKIGRFKAQIQSGGTAHHLGWFDELECAALAYAVAANDFHGEFACIAR